MARNIKILGDSGFIPDTPALSADVNDNFDIAIGETAKYAALSSFKILQSNNIFKNGSGVYTDEFLNLYGTNQTSGSLLNTANFSNNSYSLAPNTTTGDILLGLDSLTIETTPIKTLNTISTGRAGARFEALNNIKVHSFTKLAAVTATTLYIRDTNLNLLDTVLFVGDTATLTTPLSLLAGEQFIYEIDAVGANYTLIYSTSAPSNWTTTNLKYINRFQLGVDNTPNISEAWNIDTIQTSPAIQTGLISTSNSMSFFIEKKEAFKDNYSADILSGIILNETTPIKTITGTNLYRIGARFEALNNIKVHSFTKLAAVTATTLYIRDTNLNLLDTVLFVGDTATLTTPLSLLAGEQFIYETDAVGANYTFYYSNTTTSNWTTTNLKYVNRFYLGVDEAIFNHSWNIDTIQTETFTPGAYIDSTQETSIEVSISDGTTSTTPVVVDADGFAIVSTLSLNQTTGLTPKITLKTNDVTLSPKVYGYGLKVIK